MKSSPPKSSEMNETVVEGVSDSDSCNAHDDKRERVLIDDSTGRLKIN